MIPTLVPKRHVVLAALAAALFVSSSRADESNRNEVRANLEKDGWRVVWGKNFTEADWAQGTAAIAESVASESPGPFLRWFDETLDENMTKIERNLPGVLQDNIKQWIVQSLKQKTIVVYKNFQIQAGFATYNRWQRIVYDEPRTGQRRVNGPLGTWTYVPYAYTQRVEKQVPLPNWNQFYIRYLLGSGGGSATGGGAAAGTQRMINYTLTNESPYPVTLEFSPTGTTSQLAPGRSTKARSPARGEQYPKVKATASNGNSWERTMRNDGGDYRIISIGDSKIQIVP